jgi:hypothetical protein
LKAIFGGWIHCAVRHRRAEWRNPVIADQSAQARGLPIHDAILRGAVSRLRPVVMTALMTMLGL